MSASNTDVQIETEMSALIKHFVLREINHQQHTLNLSNVVDLHKRYGTYIVSNYHNIPLEIRQPRALSTDGGVRNVVGSYVKKFVCIHFYFAVGVGFSAVDLCMLCSLCCVAGLTDTKSKSKDLQNSYVSMYILK